MAPFGPSPAVPETERASSRAIARRSRATTESGASTLTVVLVLPVVLFLVSTVAQFVVYFHAAHVATAAAAEGVRAAQMADGTAGDAQAQATDFLAQAGPNLVLTPSVVVSRDTDVARVEVVGHAPQLLPGITLGLRAVATGPVERFVGDSG